VFVPLSAVHTAPRVDRVALAVVLGVDDNSVAAFAGGINGDLHLGIGVNTDVKDTPMFGEPCICPTA
jgi:hypothetical protein